MELKKWTKGWKEEWKRQKEQEKEHENISDLSCVPQWKHFENNTSNLGMLSLAFLSAGRATSLQRRTESTSGARMGIFFT